MKKVFIIFMCISVMLGMVSCDTDEASSFVDLTQLSSVMVYAEVYNMMVYPEDYIDKTVKMTGMFVLFESYLTAEIFTACLILDATECCSQGMEFLLANNAVYPDGYPELGTMITVTGTFRTYEEAGYTYCHLVDSVMEIV